MALPRHARGKARHFSNPVQDYSARRQVDQRCCWLSPGFAKGLDRTIAFANGKVAIECMLADLWCEDIITQTREVAA